MDSAGLDVVDPGVGAGAQGVRALFGLSVHALPETAQRLFCWAGLFPGASFTAAAMAATADLSPARTESVLERLADEYLLEHRPGGRYELHDLLGLFAAEFVSTVDGGGLLDERRAAERRLGDYYLAATAAAMDVLYPDAKHRRAETPSPTAPLPRFAGAADAHAWLTTEHRNIIGLSLTGAADPVPMSVLLWEHLKNTSRLTDALRLNTAALAAVPPDDVQRRARILNQLGIAHECLGHYAESLGCLERSAELYRAAGERRGVSAALSNMAVLHYDRGDLAQALEASYRALDIARELDDGWREGVALGNTGGILVQLGRFTEAIDLLEKAIAVCLENGNNGARASAVGHLGEAHLRLGDSARALTVLTEALALSRRLKKRNNESEHLVMLGRAHAASGDPERALAAIHQGLEIARDNGPHCEVTALTALGDTYRSLGDLERARTHYRDALSLADTYRIHRNSPLRKNVRSGHRGGARWDRHGAARSRAGRAADPVRLRTKRATAAISRVNWASAARTGPDRRSRPGPPTPAVRVDGQDREAAVEEGQVALALRSVGGADRATQEAETSAKPSASTAGGHRRDRGRRTRPARLHPCPGETASSSGGRVPPARTR